MIDIFFIAYICFSASMVKSFVGNTSYRHLAKEFYFIPQWRDSIKKHNIQGDIRTLLGRNCEMEKIMRILKGIEMFEEI